MVIALGCCHRRLSLRLLKSIHVFFFNCLVAHVKIEAMHLGLGQVGKLLIASINTTCISLTSMSANADNNACSTQPKKCLHKGTNCIANFDLQGAPPSVQQHSQPHILHSSTSSSSRGKTNCTLRSSSWLQTTAGRGCPIYHS